MEPTAAVELVAAKDWQRWSEQNDAVIIDVREPAEWAVGTLPGSTLISLGSIPGYLDDLDRDQAVLIVCRTAQRSGAAAQFMVRHGFNRVANLMGGLVALGLA